MFKRLLNSYYAVCKPIQAKNNLLYSQIYITNVLAFFLSVLSLPYALLFYTFSVYLSVAVIIAVSMYILTIILNRLQFPSIARVNFVTTASTAIIIFGYILPDLGIPNLFIALIVAPLLITDRSERLLKGVLVALPAVSFFIVSYLNYGTTNIFFKISDVFQFGLYLSIFLVIMTITYLIVNHYAHMSWTAKSDLMDSLKELKDKEQHELYLKEQLEDSLGNLKKSNQELEDAYEDLKNTQEKELKIKALLEESEKTASLIHLMNEYNHEIKSPWSVIMSCVANEKCSHERLIKTIKKQYTRVDQTLDTMIKILNGNRTFNLTNLDINTTIESVLDMFVMRSCTVIKDFGPVPNVKGDLQDLQILFTNLFKNIVEALTLEKQTVLIVTRYIKEKNQVCIQITDTGKGMDIAVVNEIQSKGWSESNKKNGAGVGLMVVNRIVEQHNGSISITSQKDVGSSFKIMLPAVSSPKS